VDGANYNRQEVLKDVLKNPRGAFEEIDLGEIKRDAADNKIPEMPDEGGDELGDGAGL